MGVVTFGAMIFVLGLAEEEPPETPVISYIGFAFAAISLVAATVVPKLMTSVMRNAVLKAKPSNDDQVSESEYELQVFSHLAGVFQTKEIIGRAILEGAAFLNLVAYLLEGQPMSIALVALLLVAMLIGFPTRGRLASFMRDETATIEQLRQLERT